MKLPGLAPRMPSHLVAMLLNKEFIYIFSFRRLNAVLVGRHIACASTGCLAMALGLPCLEAGTTLTSRAATHPSPCQTCSEAGLRRISCSEYKTLWISTLNRTTKATFFKSYFLISHYEQTS